LKKELYIILTFCLIVLTVKAQINIAPYGTFVRNLNKSTGGNTIGSGLLIEISKEESLFNIYVDASYCRPIITRSIVEGIAFNSGTNPSRIYVAALYKVPIYRLEFGNRFYITGSGRNKDGVNVFANIAVALTYTPCNARYELYNDDLYTLGFMETSQLNPDGTEKHGADILFVLGAGIEKKIGIGNLFFLTSIGIPTTQAGPNSSNSELSTFYPIPLNLSIGYKFIL